MKKWIFFILISIALIFTACSSKSDKEYYDNGLQLIKTENYSDALMEFETLLKEYPKSEFTEKAVFEIGKLYHGRVIKNLSAEESFRKAIEYYSRLYKEFPNAENAPNSMFMVGFILANDLKAYDEAKQVYSEFLAKYPNSELVSSAQEELNNIGLDPEEILKQKLNKPD